MSDNTFAKALHNFTMDVACGDAIRHLTDKGYLPGEIREKLTFPAPMEYVEEVMWERLVETRKVIDEPSPRASANPSGSEIIEHRDAYGRKSFLQVKKESPGEMIFSPEDYVQYENLLVFKHAQEQVSALSDHILRKVRSTGSHRDM